MGKITNKEKEQLGYKKTSFTDVNKNPIYEGDVIIADGYGDSVDYIIENPENASAYCVEYDEVIGFVSCAYNNDDLLIRYDTIRVTGHCEDIRHLVEQGYTISGNINWVLKKNDTKTFLDFVKEYKQKSIIKEIDHKSIYPKFDLLEGLSPNAKAKLDFILGHHCVTGFPEHKPTREWMGAVLDLLEELNLLQK